MALHDYLVQSTVLGTNSLNKADVPLSNKQTNRQTNKQVTMTTMINIVDVAYVSNCEIQRQFTKRATIHFNLLLCSLLSFNFISTEQSTGGILFD